VQHFDKISMKMMFEDQRFQDSVSKKRAYKLLADLELAYQRLWPDVPGFGEGRIPDDWAETAVKLKQTRT
jgi:hypothetical protein